MVGGRGTPVGIGKAGNGWIRAWGLRIRLWWSTAVLVEAGSGHGDGGTAMAGAPAGEEEEGEGEENDRREEGEDGQGISALMSGEVRSPTGCEEARLRVASGSTGSMRSRQGRRDEAGLVDRGEAEAGAGWLDQIWEDPERDLVWRRQRRMDGTRGLKFRVRS